MLSKEERSRLNKHECVCDVASACMFHEATAYRVPELANMLDAVEEGIREVVEQYERRGGHFGDCGMQKLRNILYFMEKGG